MARYPTTATLYKDLRLMILKEYDWRVIGIIGPLGLSMFAVAAALLAPHQEYEFLFYNILPKSVWAIFIITLVSALMLLIQGTSGNHQAWRNGVILLIGLYLVFWFLPTISGLRFWAAPRGDMLGHFGDVKTILSTGHNPDTNMYPGMHFLLSQMVAITHIRIGLTQPILSGAYYFTFVIGLYVLGRQLTNSKAAKFVGVTAAPLVFTKYTHNLMPWFMSFALIPLFIHGVESDRTRRLSFRYRTIGVVLILGLGSVFIHPMSSILAAGLILLIWAVFSLMAFIQSSHFKRPSILFVGVFLIPHAIWYLTQPRFKNIFAAVVSAFVEASVGAASKAEVATEASYTTRQLLFRFIIFDYGPLLLYLIAAGLILAATFYLRFQRGEPITDTDALMVTIYASGLALAVLMLSINLVINNPYRMNQITLLSAILIIGIGLYRLLDSDSVDGFRIACGGGLILVVTAALVLSPFTVYDEEKHIIETEMAGADAHLQYRNPDIPTRAMVMSHHLSVFLEGKESSPIWTEWAFAVNSPQHQLPSHAGYDTNSSATALFKNHGYIITKTRDAEWIHNQPPNRRPSVRYLTSTDLAQLNGDKSAMRVYDNGGFITWQVIGNQGKLSIEPRD